jgi:uncharacterized membrane protein
VPEDGNNSELLYHGHLSLNNIIIEKIWNDDEVTFNAKISGFGLFSLYKYARVFMNYSNLSVYSAPELFHDDIQKKNLDS